MLYKYSVFLLCSCNVNLTNTEETEPVHSQFENQSSLGQMYPPARTIDLRIKGKVSYKVRIEKLRYSTVLVRKPFPAYLPRSHDGITKQICITKSILAYFYVLQTKTTSLWDSGQRLQDKRRKKFTTKWILH